MSDPTAPVRVLSISTLFPGPARPAFGRFVANQMRAVAARGDADVTMVNPVGIPPWPLSLHESWRSQAAGARETVLDGLRVLHPQFTTIPKIGGDGNPARIARAVLPLVRALHAERPFDVIDAQFFFPDGPAAAAIARALALPLVIKARGSDIHYWGTRPKAAVQMRAAADQSARLLAVSAALAADMVALGMPAERIAVHYTGLDRARFQPMDRAAARASVAGLGIPGDDPLLVLPGALIVIKGQRLAISALAELPHARLAIAGTGADEVALRDHAAVCGVAERVHFLGQVGHDVLPTLLSAADVVVLPSEREGLANVWVEALACGTPLVIPDIGGAREVVQGAGAGRIAVRNPAAIAQAVAAILADPPAPDDVARNAERFSWDRNAAELVRHWREIAAS